MKLAALMSAAFLLAACTAPERPAAGRAGFDAAGSPQVEQSGPILEPASVATDESTVTIPIPAGSVISFCDAAAVGGDRAVTPVTGPGAAEPGTSRRDVAGGDERRRVTPWNVTVSAPTELRAHRRAVVVIGAKSYPPPSGPSPSQKAAGKAAWLYRVGLVGGLALAFFGFRWKGALVVTGGLSVAGASAFGWFVEDNPWALRVFGGGVFLAAFGFALWHLWLKKRQGLIAK